MNIIKFDNGDTYIITANGQVLQKAGYSVFSQPIPKLICFSTAEDRICCRLEFRRPDN